MAAAQARTAVPPYRIDLVDEDDAGRVLLALLEEVSDARSAHTDEHLDEVGAADREERHASLAGDRPRKERLARSRRADQEHTLGDLAAELLELLRVLQDLDDLLDLDLGLVHAGDFIEGHLLGAFAQELGLALAEGKGLVAAHLHVAHDEKKPERHENERGPDHKEVVPRRLLDLLRIDLDAFRHQFLAEIGIIN